MSFSPDIRASGNFRRQFAKEKRRLQLSEIPKSDIDSMQEHVPEIRSATQFMDVTTTRDNENISSVPDGPHDYIFEPDYNQVKIRTCFMDNHGIANAVSQTINGLACKSIELYDQANSTAVPYYSLVTSAIDPNDFTSLWQWKLGFRGPNLKRGNSVSLNVNTEVNQFVYFSNWLATAPFTASDFTVGFWIYPTDVTSTGIRIVAYNRVDTNNKWSIEIDTDSKLFAIVKRGGVETKQESISALTANNWYFIAFKWDESVPEVTLKVNDVTGTSTTKTSGTVAITPTDLFFGSHPNLDESQRFEGYLTGITYYYNDYKTATELTRLYNYNTVSNTTNPGIWGIMQYG